MREEIQKKSVEVALENKYGTLALAVRTGKTKVGLEIALNFDKVLVSYPNVSILTSWEEDAQKFGYDIRNITFTTHVSIHKHRLFEYDVVILDEIDQVSEAQWTYISEDVPKRMYGLTGTPAISGVKFNYMKAYCPVIYEVKLDETVGVLQKDYEIIVHLLEPSNKSDIPLKSGKFWSERQKIQFWENKYNSSHDFMNMLRLIQTIQNSQTKLDYLKKLSNKIDDKCLIFLETTKQCDDCFTSFYSYHSKNKASETNLKLFQRGKINQLACVKQLSAGITFHNLNTCIILHSYASNNKFHQRMARCLQYCEGEKATIHLICLNNTRDLDWCKKGLSDFDKNKIKYITI